MRLVLLRQIVLIKKAKSNVLFTKLCQKKKRVYRNLLLRYSYSFLLRKNPMNHLICFYGSVPEKALPKHLSLRVSPHLFYLFF